MVDVPSLADGIASWSRVDDLVARVAQMKRDGARFRNEIVVGPGGKQVLLEDPDGNVVELFEPAR